MDPRETRSRRWLPALVSATALFGLACPSPETDPGPTDRWRTRAGEQRLPSKHRSGDLDHRDLDHDPGADGSAPCGACVGEPRAVSLPLQCDSPSVRGKAHAEREPSPGETELHVIQIYEAQSSGSWTIDAEGTPHAPPHLRGEVLVEVDRPGTHVLALAAYEPVHWRIHASRGATIEAVLLSGFYRQSVDAPPGAAVESLYLADEEGSARGRDLDEPGAGLYLQGDCPAGSAGAWPDPGANCLVTKIEQRTGLRTVSFRGAYQANRFTIEPCHARVVPPYPTRTGRRGLLERCGHLQRQAHCATLAQGVPALIGLESGELCVAEDDAPPAFGGGPVSLGWIGDALYGCGNHELPLSRLDLRTGRLERTSVDCAAATDRAGKLLVVPWPASHGTQLKLYDDFTAAQTLPPVSCSTVGGPLVDRISVHGDKVYTAWHATDAITETSLRDGGQRTIQLEGFENWVMGLSATDTGELLILSPAHGAAGGSPTALHVFDLQSGQRRRTLPLNGVLSGLSCRPAAGC